MDVDADGAEDETACPAAGPATTPALRGPARSSQPPQSAADTPSTTKNSVYIQPMLATRQSQVVVNNSCASVMSGQAFDAVIPSARDSGKPEHRKAVGHADAQMDAERRRRHQPSIEAGFGDDAFAVEKADVSPTPTSPWPIAVMISPNTLRSRAFL